MFQALARRLITAKRGEVQFIVFVSFLITFIFVRSYVYLTNRDIMNLPTGVVIRGVHVHHFIFGIFLLAVVSFVALYDIRPVVHRRLAVIYGISLGLIFDEFSLWLRLTNDYYARVTYDALVIIVLLFLNIIYFPHFWNKMGKKVTLEIHKIYKIIKAE